MISSTVAMYNDPGNDINGGWSFWTWKKVPGKNPALEAITPTSNWVTVMNWLGAPDKKNIPSSSQSLSALAEFVQAVRFENNHIDSQMLAALQQK